VQLFPATALKLYGGGYVPAGVGDSYGEFRDLFPDGGPFPRNTTVRGTSAHKM